MFDNRDSAFLFELLFSLALMMHTFLSPHCFQYTLHALLPLLILTIEISSVLIIHTILGWPHPTFLASKTTVLYIQKESKDYSILKHSWGPYPQMELWTCPAECLLGNFTSTSEKLNIISDPYGYWIPQNWSSSIHSFNKWHIICSR